jgi:hypothetical protein
MASLQCGHSLKSIVNIPQGPVKVARRHNHPISRIRLIGPIYTIPDAKS